MARSFRCNRRFKDQNKNAGKLPMCGKRFSVGKLNPIHKLPVDEISCPICDGPVCETTAYKRTENKKNRCYCDGLHFSMKGAPHRKGSKWCKYYKGKYNEEDWQEYYSRK